MELKTILQSVTIFFALQSSAQTVETIKDYYIPANGKNKATFYTPNDSCKTGFKTVVYYVDKNSSYEIKMVSGNINGEGSIGIATIIFSNDEIKETQSIVSNRFSDNRKTVFLHPVIILKMPEIGKIASWTTRLNRQKIYCSTSWTTVNFNGEQVQAIKLVQEVKGKYHWIQYYVKGIGLWKIECHWLSTGETATINKFDALDYDPKAESINTRMLYRQDKHHHHSRKS